MYTFVSQVHLYEMSPYTPFHCCLS